MGYGLGAAIGAKMGRPEKTVVNIAGDGCFRMNMNELANSCTLWQTADPDCYEQSCTGNGASVADAFLWKEVLFHSTG